MNRINLWALIFFAGILITILIIYNLIKFSTTNVDEVKELPTKEVQLSDPFEKIDEEWKLKVEKQRQIEEQGKIEQFWRADIKREMHSIRAQYNIFLKLNHQIEKERREKERLERIRIQKEKAAERKRIAEEKKVERKRLSEEKKTRKHAKIHESTQWN